MLLNGIFVFTLSAPLALSQPAPPSRTFLFYVSSDDAQLFGDAQFVDHVRHAFSGETAANSQALVLFDPMPPKRPAELFALQNGVPHAVEPITDFANAAREQCVPDPTQRTEKGGVASVDMGCEHTLSRFLSVARALPPTDETILVFVGHGSGWMGFGTDSNADRDSPAHSLKLAAMKKTLDQHVESVGRRLDGVMFNACLMGTWEVALEFATVAKWFSAPSQSVWFAGSDLTENLEEARKAGHTPEWIHENIRKKYDFSAYHFKFHLPDLLHLNTAEMLLAIQDTRVLIERDPTPEKPRAVYVVDQRDPIFAALQKHDGVLTSDGKTFRVAPMNNLLVDLDQLTALGSLFRDKINPALRNAFSTNATELTEFSRMEKISLEGAFGGDMNLYSSLADLLTFAKTQVDFDDPFYATFKRNIRPYSVFLPSSDFVRMAGEVESVDSALGKRGESFAKQVWNAFHSTRFAEEFDWKSVVGAYRAGFRKQLQTLDLNPSELDFGRNFVE